MHKRALEAIVRILRDIRNRQSQMKGITAAFLGDFRKILSDIPKGKLMMKFEHVEIFQSLATRKNYKSENEWKVFSTSKLSIFILGMALFICQV